MPAQVAQVLEEIRLWRKPLRGVFHAAGMLEDSILLNQSAERLLRVMAPKVDGGWILHEQTLDQPLDFFVLYSSATTYLGNPTARGAAKLICESVILTSN